jgi:hypothetical protein
MGIYVMFPAVHLVWIPAACTVVIAVLGIVYSGFSQELDDPPLKFTRSIELVVSNPIDRQRLHEPVIIPVESIIGKAPDFNPNFFRIKHETTRFEPLDIPSQVRTIPGVTGAGKELVFQLDMEAKGQKKVELQYNPEGVDLPDYPVRTRSFESWYRDGSNSAWENELIAYRYYFGMVDYFGKSYRVLCLDRLRSDSYHHERLWGQDPYAVGKTPGLGGIALVGGDSLTKCYGYPDDAPSNVYVYSAHGGGPVCAGVVLRTEDRKNGGFLVEASTTLYHGRYENHVRAAVDREHLESGVHIAPGMRKFDGEHVTLDEHEGCILAWGRPVEEYGTIGTSFIWDPERFRGIHETSDARFIRLEPGEDSTVSYCTLAVWYRASAEQPANQEVLFTMVRDLSLGFRNPLRVEIAC